MVRLTILVIKMLECMAIGLPMLRLFEQKYSTQDSPPQQESLHTSDEKPCES